MVFPPASRRSRIPASLVIALAAFFLLLGAGSFAYRQRPRVYHLRISGGDALGHRHVLANLLAEQSDRVRLRVIETPGSRDALEQVASGGLDLALVQGGQGKAAGVVEVATLGVEPLHLLVRPEIAASATGVSALRGKRLSLSTQGSGTRKLAQQTLSFAGLEAGRDYADEDWDYASLKTRDAKKLPDGIFTVSLLPSPVAEQLIRRHGYRLMPLPFGDALALRDYTATYATIPAYTYEVSPPVPPRALPTVGNRLLLVANRRVPEEAVHHLLKTITHSEFRQRANLPYIEEKTVARFPEMPLHPGTVQFLSRNDPIMTAVFVQSMESLRSFLVSVALGLFLLWRWSRQRRMQGFEIFLAEVTQLEKRALALETEPILNLRELMAIRNRLSAVKTEALEQFAAGQLKGAELMTSFLTHASDVRNYLTRLVLYERERIADLSADDIPNDEQEARFREEWGEALAGGDSDANKNNIPFNS